MLNAIAQGMFHQSMKEKLDILEARKSEIKIALVDAELNKSKNSINRAMVKKYIEKDTYPSAKDEENQKRIVQRYIKKIDLYPDKAKVNFVLDIDGCGTRIRTQTK